MLPIQKQEGPFLTIIHASMLGRHLDGLEVGSSGPKNECLGVMLGPSSWLGYLEVGYIILRLLFSSVKWITFERE